MPIYSGIDEAGLGPILGPFCASVTTFSAPGPLKEILKDQQKKLLYVDDSKKVYQGKKGLEKLELNVLSFWYLLTNTIPEDSNTFIPTLGAPWYNTPVNLPIKVDKESIKNQAQAMGDLFNDRDIKLLDIKRSVVTASDFNTLIDKWDNKSVVCQKIIDPLIRSTLHNRNDHILVIDKQGGRKFYMEYLESLMPGEKTSIIFEENNHSRYRSGGIDVNFMAKADSLSFEVALSSMFSKYMREISMLCFNNYWNKKLPNIKRTAGYYTDGMRFIKELEENRLFPDRRDSIIRKK